MQVLDQRGQPVPGVIIEGQSVPAPAVPPADAIIDQVNRTFIPMVTLISKGQRVRFPNSDNVRHHVYSFSEAKQFSTPLYADEDVDPIEFDRPGIVTLGCNIHDSMVAYVFVSEWQDVWITDMHGKVSIPAHLYGDGQFHVWHPWLTGTDQSLSTRLLLQAEQGEQQLEIHLVSPEQPGGFRALRNRSQQ